jgi:hypothetical protein
MSIPYNKELMRDIIPILKNFKYHIISYRELLSKIDCLPGEREFWVYTCDAHLQMAAISWCMVFGTDSNPTHWKKLSQGNTSSLKNFVTGKIGISDGEYHTKWKEIIDFRNTYIAHKKGFDKPVPYFSFAETVVDCFELWVINIFHPDELEQFLPLSNLWETCTLDIKNVIECITKLG